MDAMEQTIIRKFHGLTPAFLPVNSRGLNPKFNRKNIAKIRVPQAKQSEESFLSEENFKNENY